MEFTKRGVVAWGLLLLTVLFSGASSAGEGLDIQSWESRPGVKLVAVDFYADWCKPCKAALPKWDALLQKYHERGLRLVIVTATSHKRPKAQRKRRRWRLTQRVDLMKGKWWRKENRDRKFSKI